MRRQKIIRQLATATVVLLIGTVPILALLRSITLICEAAPPPIQEPLAPPDNFFDSNGVRIRYVDQGHGPPVVLIHGYTGYIERHWIATGVFANLLKDHRVIALDCRGHGKSAKPTDPKAYGAEMAQDIVRLLDHLKIRRAHVVGFSMGAVIAGRLLVTNADRLLTVTFVGHHPMRKWTTLDQQQAEAAARELEGDLPFRSLILAISPPGVPPPTEDEIRTLSRRLSATNDLKALAAFHRGLRTLTVTDAQLAAVRVPALEILGSEDPNLADAQELRKAMPGLNVVVVDGATHGGERGVLQRPELLAALGEFYRLRAPTFIFHSDEVWLNLHHFLYALGRAENQTNSSRAAFSAVLADQEKGLARLMEKERMVWHEAVAWYAAGLSKKDLIFDDSLPQFTTALARAGHAKSLKDAGVDLSSSQMLERVVPIYLKAWWRKHQAANQAWARAMKSLVDRYGATVLAFITKAYRMEWPAAGYGVHICTYAGWSGAYSTKGLLLVVSSLRQENEGAAGI